MQHKYKWETKNVLKFILNQFNFNNKHSKGIIDCEVGLTECETKAKCLNKPLDPRSKSKYNPIIWIF